MNRYTEYLAETQARIDLLTDRAARWSKHPTLHTRVPAIEAEIKQLHKQLPILRGTAKLAHQMWG